MPSSETALSYITAGISFLTLLSPLIIYIKYHTPAALIGYFDELLIDTKQIYNSAIAEGLLPPGMSTEAGAKLRKYQVMGDVLRTAKYNTFSLPQYLRSCIKFKSKTRMIERVSRGLKNLRNDILTASQEERERRTGAQAPACNESSSELDASLMDLLSDLSLRKCDEDAPSCSQIREPSAIPGNGDLTLPSFTSTISTPNDTLCVMCSLRHWLSHHFFRGKANPPSSMEQQLSERDLDSSLSDIRSLSRSSTLVGDQLSEGPSIPWWRPACWKPSNKDRWEVMESLEAGSFASDVQRASLDSPQKEMDITSMLG
ncbi:hypothetical protein D9615_008949 [Tricholomella constricta]|uniref:Uncharacterized protein n=1 Tax=Tricholomella constricta TaxID=117010 RepID=A0A8H5H146_9AGAR|nr:hypothetical protein D9615_008949 [Tricholomella constricta]